jgi:hypothetical protein
VLAREIVPVVVIGPPVSPVPVTMFVTEPVPEPVPASGAQAHEAPLYL